MILVKGFAGCEVIRNGGCGFAKHIGHNKIQCHIADSKRILKPVFLAAFHRDQFVAVAGKLAKNTDIQVWDEAAFTRPIRNRSPIHLESFVSSLFPFTAFTHLGLAITTRTPRFSSMLNTGTQYFPVDSMQTSRQLCSNNQSAKRFSSELKVLKRFFLVVGLQTVCGSGDDSSNHKCFVNIYTATGWKYDFHNKTSS